MGFRLATLALTMVGISGCVLDPVDLANRRCPCLGGWVCDVPRDRCVRSLGGDDAGADQTGADGSTVRDGGPVPIDAALDSARVGSAADDAATDGPAIDDAAIDDAAIDDAAIDDAAIDDAAMDDGAVDAAADAR